MIYAHTQAILLFRRVHFYDFNDYEYTLHTQSARVLVKEGRRFKDIIIFME